MVLMELKYETFWPWCQQHSPPLGLIIGDDDFLVEDSIQTFQKALKKKHPNLKSQRVNIQKVGDWPKLADSLSSRDFFTKEQLIICHYPQTALTSTSTPIVQATLERLQPKQWILFISKKLTPKQKKHAVHGYIAKQGFMLTLWPLNMRALNPWIQNRAKAHYLTLNHAQIQYLIEQTDGQPWAISQSLSRLEMLKTDDVLTQEQLESAITVAFDPAIYTLINETLEGKTLSALKRYSAQILPTMLPALTGALVREVRLLYRIAWDKQTSPLSLAIKNHCHWPAKQRYLERAVERHTLNTLSTLLKRLFALDQINKGMATGDATVAMQDILILLATAQSKRTLVPMS